MPKTKKTILVIDVSTVAHTAWANVEKSTPTLELKCFKALYFQGLYEIMLAVPADDVVLAQDAPGGLYWRHREYEKFYATRVEYAVYGSDNTVMLQHDGNMYYMEQTSVGKWKKNQIKKQADRPTDVDWVPLTKLHSEECPILKYTNEFDLDIEEYSKMVTDACPTYKGNRKSKVWEYTTTKKEWNEKRAEITRDVADAVKAICVRVPLAEADDICAHIAQVAPDYFQIVIASVDGDLDQLQVKDNVVRYDIHTREYVESEDHAYKLKVKILAGDNGDNIKSCKIPVVNAKGETKLKGGPGLAADLIRDFPGKKLAAKAKKEGWLDQLMFNATMINLKKIPDTIREAIRADLNKETKIARAIKPKKDAIYKFGNKRKDIDDMRAEAHMKHVKFGGEE